MALHGQKLVEESFSFLVYFSFHLHQNRKVLVRFVKQRHYNGTAVKEENHQQEAHGTSLCIHSSMHSLAIGGFRNLRKSVQTKSYGTFFWLDMVSWLLEHRVLVGSLAMEEVFSNWASEIAGG